MEQLVSGLPMETLTAVAGIIEGRIQKFGEPFVIGKESARCLYEDEYLSLWEDGRFVFLRENEIIYWAKDSLYEAQRRFDRYLDACMRPASNKVRSTMGAKKARRDRNKRARQSRKQNRA